MIYNNIKLMPPEPVLVAISHGQKELVFKARILTQADWEFHDKFNPMPTPPEKHLAGGKIEVDTKEPGYLKQFEEYAKRRVDFTFVRALDCNPDLVLESLNISDSSTWGNYRQEMADAGFTDMSISNLFGQVMEVNSYNPSRLEQAKKDFLATH